jgi:hypothetical protein
MGWPPVSGLSAWAGYGRWLGELQAVVRLFDHGPGWSKGFVAAVALMAVAAVAGCSPGSSDPRRLAADELHRAAQATLAAKSFVVHTRPEDPSRVGDGSGFEWTEVYQAPDRLHRKVTAGPQTVSDEITITTDRYRADLTSDGRYLRSSEPPTKAPEAIDRFLADIRPLATATDVRREGSIYHYTVDAGGRTLAGRASISGGRIESFTNPGGGRVAVLRSTISDYDRAAAVEPPPADRMVEEATIEPAITDLLTE